MKLAVIFAHPDPGSFTAHMASTYAEAAQALGHSVVVRDLYGMGFDPCLKAAEIPLPAGFAPGPDVKAERAEIADAGVFAFFYPLWFNAPPAMLKGYMDRVFGRGFAYGREDGGHEPLLMSKRMVSFTSSGAPHYWLEQTGAWNAMRTLFDEHFAAVCGLTVVDHVHFDRIVPGITEEAVESCADMVRKTVARL